MSILKVTDALRGGWSFPDDGLEEYLILLGERSLGLKRLSQFTPSILSKHGHRGFGYTGALICKGDLRSNFDSYASAELNGMHLWWKTTSGTSGRPVDVPYAPEFYLDLKYCSFHKVWQMLHGEPLGGKSYLALVVSDVAGDKSSICVDPLFSQGVVARVSIDVGDRQQMRAILALMSSLHPTFLSTKPSVLSAMVGASLELVPRADVIIVGGAALSPTLREAAEKRFGGRAVSLYATSEIGVIASECAHGRLHIFESDLEVIDDHPEAPSEIVVTNLGNRALPLASYRTGDRGTIARESCECGAAWRWIERLEGRVVPLFRFSKGEIFSPTRFNGFLRCFPKVREFQVTLAANDELEILVEHLEAQTDEDQACMERFFAEALPEYVRLQLSNHTFDPNDKFTRFRVTA